MKAVLLAALVLSGMLLGSGIGPTPCTAQAFPGGQNGRGAFGRLGGCVGAYVNEGAVMGLSSSFYGNGPHGSDLIGCRHGTHLSELRACA